MRKEKRILLVDDNEDVITTYRVVLDRMGYTVIQAVNGNECLERIEDKRPDLIFLDVRLPGLSGTEVCRLIKDTAKTRDIPVIAITASMSADTRVKMGEVGADEFLLKPIDASELSQVVRKYLD